MEVVKNYLDLKMDLQASSEIGPPSKMDVSRNMEAIFGGGPLLKGPPL